MIDGETIRSKLVGSKEERAVSPVIGVILMVAITVILAAVIAAFVLDMGGSIGQEAQAGAAIEVDEEANEVHVEVQTLGNADYVELGGAVANAEPARGGDGSTAADELELEVGDTVTLTNPDGLSGDSGTVTAVAVMEEDDTQTQVASEDFDF